MKGYDVVVVGGVNTDYLIKAERLPGRGETLQGDVFQEAPGGKGANQAVAVARLGCRVGLIARVGQDERGDTINRRLTEADIRATKDTIASAKVFLAQLEVPVPAVALGLRLARAAGLTTVLDPAPAVPLEQDVLQLVDVVRPNASEAETLTGVPVRDRASATAAARILLRRGVGAVIVQAGDAGDLLLTAHEERFLPRLPVESVDATGAGDAFAGALAAALAEKRSLVDAAALGSRAAALATTKLGAQAGLPRRSELLRAEGQTAASG
jgi:ribokinase